MKVGEYMAILNLELKHVSSIERSIKNVVNELDNRKTDYEGIIKNINNMSSSTSNLGSCNYYLKKKNEQLDKKMEKLNSFKTKISTLSTNAKAADSKVATYVIDQSHTFYKTVGIKTGWAKGWNDIKAGAKSVWNAVTNFYEKHKYVIDFVVDLAMVAVAVVSLIAAIPTGGATLVFSIWAIADSIGNLVGSSVALGYHIAGDDEKAGIWAERGLKDGLQFVFKGIDVGIEAIFGVSTTLFSDLAGIGYEVMNIVSFSRSLISSGKDIVKAFKNSNVRKLSLQGVDVLFGLNLTPGTSKAGYKAITNTFSFIKNGKQAYTLVKTCGYIKNVKTTVKLVGTLFKGTFTSDGIAVVKDIKDAWESLTSIYRTSMTGGFVAKEWALAE